MIPPLAHDPAWSLDKGLVWEQARAALDGLPGNGLNIAHEAVDRHASGAHRDRVAIRWIGPHGTRDTTYGELGESTSRFANVLRRLGVGAGDKVFTLLGRDPALYVTALGALKLGAVFCPLFSVFGPEPIRNRMSAGGARVLVTSRRQYERKIAQLRASLPALEHVLITDKDAPPFTEPFWPLLEASSDVCRVISTNRETPALLHFTSGTTGAPKGVIHSHDVVVGHYASARFAFNLGANDVLWCTADPGWITGTCYGIIAPLVMGATLLADSGDFDAERWCRVLQDSRVTVWYTSPTAIRMMMRLGDEAIRRYDYRCLRLIASVGEPLNAEAVTWGEHVFGTPFHDTWWQTETGAIMIANQAHTPHMPGSMGKPLPGIEAAVVEHRPGGIEILDTPGCRGELALRAGWPSMFRAYLDDEERYGRCFAQGWYLSGDMVTRDADGWYWFVGRADDAIKSAGHLIGPSEVERVLLAHPCVADAGVFGVPDPVIHESVKAVVVPKPGTVADEALRRELHAHARRVLGPAIAPREIAFRDRLPKTLSGKLMRRLLRAQELGLPQGDLSSLDPNL
jgi:acetyl-CoA synthetase